MPKQNSLCMKVKGKVDLKNYLWNIVTVNLKFYSKNGFQFTNQLSLKIYACIYMYVCMYIRTAWLCDMSFQAFLGYFRRLMHACYVFDNSLCMKMKRFLYNLFRMKQVKSTNRKPACIMLDNFVYFSSQSDCLPWCGRKEGSGKKLLLCE